MRADRLTLALTYSIASLGVFAALLHISPAYAVLLALCAGVGALRDWTARQPVSPWLLNFLTLCGLLVALALPSANGFIGRLLAAAITLMGGKLLGPKAGRDQLQIMLLSLLLLIGSAILTLELSFAVLFVLYLVLCTVALVWLPFGAELGRSPVPRAFVRRVTTVGVGLVVGSLPLVLLFFLALPRTASPYWRGVGPQAAPVTGFGDTVTLGDLGRIASSDAVAFRAEIVSPRAPLAETPYWRGMVLEQTDGITWSARPREPWSGPTLASASATDGTRVTQRIYLEPHGYATLFALDRASDLVSAPLYLQAQVVDGSVEARRSVGRRVRYEVVSSTSALSPTLLDPTTEAVDLDLPASVPRVVVTTARQIVGAEPDPRRKVELVMQHFHTAGYTYSLTPPPGDGHPLEVFLTGSRTGYCEHFASAAALMLRAVGVPARVVVGYLGGDYNTAGDYYLVRQRTAHAWVEAYVAGEGWLRVDPTPPGQVAEATGGAAPGRVAQFADALRLRWQSFVMGYDLDEQLAAAGAVSAAVAHLSSWRPGTSGLTDLGLLGVPMAVAVLLALLVVRNRRRGDPVDRLYAVLLRRLRRRGFARGAAEGPAAFAERAGAGLPDQDGVIGAVTGAYVRSRYGGRQPDAVELTELRRRLRRL